MKSTWIGLMAGIAVATPPFAIAATPEALLPGLWQAEVIDKETRVSEVTRIEFSKDGTYVAYMQISPFQFQQVKAGGHYSATALDAQKFMMTVERRIDDRDIDASETKDRDTITIVDDKTLRSSDGAILRRIK